MKFTVWKGCVVFFAKRYADTREPADLIVQTALGKCFDFESKYRAASFEWILAQPGNSNTIATNGSEYAVEGAKTEIRTEALTAVMERRLKQQRLKGRR